MKRGAENQLTKNQSDDDEIEEVDPSQGFKKANESILAARPMKGLPKRGNAPTSFEAPGTEKKVNFGSGSQPFSSTPSSGFTFNMPPAAPTPSVSQLSSGNTPFKFSGPPVSSNTSSASKQLSSILGSSPQMNGTHASGTSVKPLNGAKDAAEAKYFTSLRGLNETLRVEVMKLMSSDPFVDLGAALDTYKSFRATIQKEFDASQKPQGAPFTNGNSSSSLSGSKLNSSAPKSVATPSLPVPPTSFAGFGTSSSTSIPSSPSAIGGFKPDFSAASGSSSPFKFGASSTTEEKTVPSNPPFGMPSSSVGSKASIFGNGAETSKQSPFGTASTGSSPFGTASSTGAIKPPTSFGTGSAFGSISEKSDSSKSSTTTPPNIFGGSGMTSSTTAPSFGAPTSSSNSFSFGGTKSSSGSLGNPAGFSFGSNSPTPDPESSKIKDTGTGGFFSSVSKTPISFPSSTSTPSGFSFGAGTSTGAGASGSQEATGSFAKSSTPFSTSSAADSRSGTPVSADGGDTVAEDSSKPKVLGENPNDMEGEGEEEEDSVYTSRAKIFRFAKKDGQPSWVEVGVGMVRIKKHKESGATRLLSRNSANGKIMMNFKLFSGFKINRAKQSLNFVGHENGANMTFRVRVKTEEAAIELQEAIEKEVSSL